MGLEPWRVACPWIVARTVEERARLRVEYGIAEWCRAVVGLVRVGVDGVRL